MVTDDRRVAEEISTGTNFSFERKVVEFTAMGEVAFVEKRRRVVEEVSIGTVGLDRTQEIHDSVRHTEVEVEQINAEKNRS